MDLYYCRVCGRHNDDEEQFTSLVNEENELTDTGKMYEELMEFKINKSDIAAGIIKLCYSCQLQMKLFKDLKERAIKTLSMLQEQFMQTNEEISLEIEEIYEPEEEHLCEEINNLEEDSENDYEYIDVEYVTNSAPKVMERKRKTKGYYCNYCNIHFSKRDQYQEHREKVHQNKFPCMVCGKQLQTGYSLRIHERLHAAEKKPYKCDLCEKRFHQKVHLTNHLNVHNNIRQHKCEKCGKCFGNKSNLSIHIRTHTGDKRYVCDVCGKSFLLSSHLKMHAFTHTGEKSFKCELCEELFVSPATLRVHKTHLHNDNPRIYECHICAKQFKRNIGLKMHYKTHAKGSVGNLRLEEENSDDYIDFIEYSPETNK